MYMNKEDWEKLKKYAQEITTYDLIKTDVDGLKGRIRDLEEEVSHIGSWIENHDWEETSEKVSDMFENSINKDDTVKPETIMEHFQKILPYGDLKYYKLCPSHLDIRIKDYCDDPRVIPSCDKCWNRIYCDDIMKDEKDEIN